MNATLLVAACAWASALAPQEPARFQLQLDPAALLTLEARWEACRRSTYGLFAETAVLRDPRPSEARHEYAARELAPFLPAGPVAVGETWKVPSEAVLVFLRQLHPSARATLHHYAGGFGNAEGSYACLRAASGERFEILIRAHAEFELEGGVTYTPAQFEGRLLIERASSRPLAFQLVLPERDSNVDVNVPTELERTPGGPRELGFLADIGFVPRMELASGAFPASEWAISIPDVEARLRLARRFYAFARLDWLGFEEAVLVQRESGKPLHLVVLFGTLDDESC